MMMSMRRGAAVSRDRDDDLAVADLDRVGLDADGRVEDGLAGHDVVLPLVPRAAEDPPLHPIAVLVDVRGQGCPDHLAEANARGLVGTGIPQGVEAAID